MTGALKAPHHIGPHAAKADHTQFHLIFPFS
jgi:hypothetical protein